MSSKHHRARVRKHRQLKRNKMNNATTPVQDYEYEMIDGNWTTKPYGFCFKYRNYLTKNMAVLHKCEKKHCRLFHTFEQHEEWKKRPENLPDYKFE